VEVEGWFVTMLGHRASEGRGGGEQQGLSSSEMTKIIVIEILLHLDLLKKFKS